MAIRDFMEKSFGEKDATAYRGYTPDQSAFSKDEDEERRKAQERGQTGYEADYSGAAGGYGGAPTGGGTNEFAFVPFLGALGGLMAGGSMVAGAIAGGGGRETLSAEQQFELESRGLDIKEFQNYLAKTGMDFNQGMALLDPKQREQRQKMIDELFGGEGGPQAQAFENLGSMLRGEQTMADRNMLTQQGIGMGRQMGSAREQAEAMMARSNLDPRSPAYAEQMNRLESSLRSQFQGQQTNLASEQQQANQRNAIGLYEMLSQGPLAGEEQVQGPQTRGEKESTDFATRARKGLGDATSAIISGQRGTQGAWGKGSAFGAGMFGAASDYMKSQGGKGLGPAMGFNYWDALAKKNKESAYNVVSNETEEMRRRNEEAQT